MQFNAVRRRGKKTTLAAPSECNTLGCVDDDEACIKHFFALKLNKEERVNVLKAYRMRSAALIRRTADC